MTGCPCARRLVLLKMKADEDSAFRLKDLGRKKEAWL